MNETEEPAVAPDEMLYEAQNGHPFHEWVITHGNGADGWWGEGYVIHTVDPCLTFKWGITNAGTSAAMSGGMQIGETGEYVAVLLLNCVSADEPDTTAEVIDGLKAEAVYVAARYLLELGT